MVVTIGACATAGGIQGLRNFAASGAYASTVYAHPEYIDALDTSTPISAHVDVDYELHGCPIDRGQLLEVLTATLAGRTPVIPGHPVCHECKARGTVCLVVAESTACLGPVTRAGCGALCPVGRPRMLRLLRARRHDEHRFAGCAPGPCGHRSGGRVDGSSPPSTPTPPPLRAEAVAQGGPVSVTPTAPDGDRGGR